MDIGATIKKLRRERNITQEQLAEYLNVTTSAVSQWESGRTTPDITQLPVLAYIFAVSSDVLLGIDIGCRERKIGEIAALAHKKFCDGHGAEAIDTLRNGLYEYPNSYQLMVKLADNLYCTAFRQGSDEIKNAMLCESAALAEKVIGECTDMELRSDAVGIACRAYKHTGKKEVAVRLAKTMPPFHLSVNFLLAGIYEGSELVNLHRENLADYFAWASIEARALISGCGGRYDDGRPVYSDDEAIRICEKIIQIYEILFEDNDYYFYSQFVKYAYEDIAERYAARGDRENTIRNLNCAKKYTIEFSTYDGEAEHTSLLYRGIVDGGIVKSDPCDTPVRGFVDTMKDARYDFIRDDPRFTAMEEELKRYL